MARKRTKYTLRKDGRIVLSDTINGERKYFYGKTDKEVEQKRDDYIRECEKHANEAAGKGRTFEAVAADWWEQCEPRLSPNTVCGYSKESRCGRFRGPVCHGHHRPPDRRVPAEICGAWLLAKGHQQHKICDTADPQLRLPLRRY